MMVALTDKSAALTTTSAISVEKVQKQQIGLSDAGAV
jgi:hypothetical protein